jgi:YHS domain-containing protein
MFTKFKLGTLIALLVIISSCSTSTKENKNQNVINSKEKVAPLNSSITKNTKLKPSLVCFVNNKYMGIDQIPVLVEGKTYYGCCQDCVGKLKNIRSTRFANDPLTGKKVDKALAYITMAPAGNQDVLYFESEQNYLNYIKNN